jgi:hypothetical protein
MFEFEIVSINKIQFITEFKRYQGRNRDNMLKQCELMHQAKDTGYIVEALEEIGVTKRTAYKMAKVHERFPMANQYSDKVSMSALFELTQYPIDIPSHRLLEKAEVRTVRELREQNPNHVPKVSNTDYLKGIITANRKALDNIPKERLIELYQEMIQELKGE